MSERIKEAIGFAVMLGTMMLLVWLIGRAVCRAETESSLAPGPLPLAPSPGAAMAMRELSDSGVPRDVSAQLASYFADASQRLKKIVLNPPGRTAASQAYRAAFAADRVFQIDRILASLKTAASTWAGKNIPTAASAGIRLAHRQAVEAGVKTRGDVVAGKFTLVDQRAVQQFAIDTIGDLHKAADSMGATAKSALRHTQQQGLSEAQINQVLAVGVIEGRPRDTIRALRAELEKVHGEKVEINGRSFDVRYYAEMVARTKARQATVHARHERLAALDLDLVMIVGRISNNFCTAFLGQVFSLGGKSSKYPAYASLPGGGPPFHPNCSKSTRPFVEELATKREERMAEPDDTVGRLLGTDPTTAQRAFKDLQLKQDVQKRYATTEKALFG